MALNPSINQARATKLLIYFSARYKFLPIFLCVCVCDMKKVKRKHIDLKKCEQAATLLKHKFLQGELVRWRCFSIFIYISPFAACNSMALVPCVCFQGPPVPLWRGIPRRCHGRPRRSRTGRTVGPTSPSFSQRLTQLTDREPIVVRRPIVGHLGGRAS